MLHLRLTEREKVYKKQRKQFFEHLPHLSRRQFFKAAALAAGWMLTQYNGRRIPHSFQPVELVNAANPQHKFTFAYLSDTHLYKKELNERFVRVALKAIDDINNMEPKPDFVLFGGDLAQLGQPEELKLGKELLSELKVPVYMMVGEHDWFLDLGETWQELFGKPTYSFDHKGVHFVVLNSILEDDFWTERKMTPMERMLTVAQLDNPIQGRFKVGEAQIEWLKNDLARYPDETPVVIFSHSPLYKYYRPWNFWTDDCEQVHELLWRFKSVTVIHGHTHQVLTHRIRNIHFHGMLSTAWPWPYAPEGLPKLTVPFNRPDPFNLEDGCGWGIVDVRPDGYVDKTYMLWHREPMRVTARYLLSDGKVNIPPLPVEPPYPYDHIVGRTKP